MRCPCQRSPGDCGINHCFSNTHFPTLDSCISFLDLGKERLPFLLLQGSAEAGAQSQQVLADSRFTALPKCPQAVDGGKVTANTFNSTPSD